MVHPVFRCSLALALTAAFQPISAQDHWPQFRGQDSSGVSEAPGIPETWSAETNIAWRTPVPGRGWSSPIVWGNRIFLTSAISGGDEEEARKGIYPFIGDRNKPSGNRQQWMVYCFALEDGRLLWQREAKADVPQWPLHIKNSYASETPCTDGKRVYTYFGNVGLFAWTLEGEPVWERHWPEVKWRGNWGSGASPILYEGRIYIVNDNEGQSFLEAIDPATGETIWRVDRDEKSNWSTPFIWRNRVRTEIVTSSSGRVRSYDLEGNELWSLTGMSGITIPTPISGGDLVYISSGFDASRYRPVYAIRSGAQGDITLEEGRTSNAFIAWSQPKAAAYNPSPLLYQGQVYVLLDNGKLSSFDAETGREVYIGQKIHADADAFTSSPWASGGKIFCLSEDGDTFVIQAGPEMKLIRINPLGEMGMASPALIPGSLILRTREALYRISEP